MWTVVLTLIAAYLIGSLPSAYLVGRHYGVNLRQLGDGNLGAHNTYRVLGLKPAVCVGALDISKGALATWLGGVLGDDPLLPYLAALGAALGHDFSIYIRLQGGQGMAAILGGILVLQPLELLLGLVGVAFVLLVVRHWNLAWSVGMGSMVAWGWFLGRPAWQPMLLALLMVTIGLKKLVDLPVARRAQEAALSASLADEECRVPPEGAV